MKYRAVLLVRCPHCEATGFGNRCRQPSGRTCAPHKRRVEHFILCFPDFKSARRFVKEARFTALRDFLALTGRY